MDTGSARHWVLITSSALYLIWPADADPPAGWRRTDFGGTMAECVAEADALWRGRRPVRPPRTPDRVVVTGGELHRVRDRMVENVLSELTTRPAAVPYLRGQSRGIVVRLVKEMLSRCLDALEPGRALSEGTGALGPRPAEPAAVRFVVLREAGSLVWHQLSVLIGPRHTPPREVCAAAEALFDCFVELAE
ncbi:MbtH family NRPS accessory protein [Amycolatopsis sp. NPDC059021]|uniref:MbtH family NRPS accessory protein n=1 Tax=Amycolatopsis sp. NPDC059021 TaxID=3346704 RepID=UPI00366C4D2F